MELYKLEREIEKHNKKYWELGKPELPDNQYDKLLRALPQFHPLKVKINGKIKDRTYTHPQPILSVNKVFDIDALFSWMRKMSRTKDEVFILEPKYNGLMCAIYNGGKRLVTRGDSYIGEDITHKKKLIDLKRYIKSNDVRYGELVCHKSILHKFYEVKNLIGKLHTNPYETVVGLLSDYSEELLEICKEHNLYIRWVPFEQHQQLVTMDSFEMSYDIYIDKIFKLGYPIDGIVVKIEDADYFNTLGKHTHHWAGELAYKFNTSLHKSRVLDIEWVNERDRLVPYANIKPIMSDGEVIYNICLHNKKYILDNNIQVKDFITVEHVKGHNPHILSSRTSKSRKKGIIDSCPCCDGKLKNKNDDLVCKNLNCLDTQLMNIKFQLSFISNTYITEIHLKQLMILNNITNLVDLLNITYDDLVNTHRFDADEAKGIISSIKKSLKVKLTEKDLLQMLGIDLELDKSLKELLTGHNILRYGKDYTVILRNKYLLKDLMKLFKLW